MDVIVSNIENGLLLVASSWLVTINVYILY